MNQEDLSQIKSVLRAINDISQKLGETDELESELLKALQMKKKTDYNMEQLWFAKKVYKDLISQNGNLETKNNLISKFQKINRDIVIGNDAIQFPTIDQIALKAMGQYKALSQKDMEKYQAMKENRITKNGLLNYLETQDNISETDSIDQYMSEEFKSELGKLNQYDNDEKDSEFDFNVRGFESLAIQSKQLQQNDELQTNPQQETFPVHNHYHHNNDSIDMQAAYKIQQQQEKYKLKMYEDLENLDYLLKSSETSIKLTKSEYLLHIRHIYHDKLLSLKNAQELFRSQLNKMQRVHLLQLKNMESFAISAAVEMFKKKGQQVRELFNEEVQKLQKEYQDLHNLVNFYERKLRKISDKLASQENMLIDQAIYIIQHLKKKGEYKEKKNQARIHFEGMVRDKLRTFENKEYLDHAFDFYSVHLKLNIQDKSKILRGIVYQQQYKEINKLIAKVKYYENENQNLQTLMKQAQEEEKKAKQELGNASKEVINERKKLNNAIDAIHKSYEKQMKQFQNKIKSKEKELQKYRKMVNMESDICHYIINQQTKLQNEQKQDIKMLDMILSYPPIYKEYQKSVKKFTTYNIEVKKPKLIKELYFKYSQLIKEGYFDNFQESIEISGNNTRGNSTIIAGESSQEQASKMIDFGLSEDSRQVAITDINNPQLSIGQTILSHTTRVNTTSIQGGSHINPFLKTSQEWLSPTTTNKNYLQQKPNNITDSVTQTFSPQHQLLSHPQTRGRMDLLIQSYDRKQNSHVVTVHRPKRNNNLYMSLNNYTRTERPTQRDQKDIINIKNEELVQPLLKTSDRMWALYVDKKWGDLKKQKKVLKDHLEEPSLDDHSLILKNELNQNQKGRNNVLYKRDKQLSQNDRNTRRNIERFTLNNSVDSNRGPVFDSSYIKNCMKINTLTIEKQQ